MASLSQVCRLTNACLTAPLAGCRPFAYTSFLQDSWRRQRTCERQGVPRPLSGTAGVQSSVARPVNVRSPFWNKFVLKQCVLQQISEQDAGQLFCISSSQFELHGEASQVQMHVPT